MDMLVFGVALDSRTWLQAASVQPDILNYVYGRETTDECCLIVQLDQEALRSVCAEVRR